MRVINNISYKFEFYQDQYKLTDKLNTDLTYTLYYIQEGKEDKIIESKIILGIETLENKILILPVNKDGRYRLTFTEINDEYKNVYFTHSIGKRNLIIKGLHKAICNDCGCKEPCEGCLTKEAKKCLASQSLFTLTNSYLYINKDFSLTGYPEVNQTTNNLFKKYFNDNSDYINCEISKQNLNNNLSGSSSINQDIFGYYLGVYYIGWYLEAKQEIDSLDLDSLEYLDKVYNYKKLSQCVKKLGISINDLEDNFNIQPINVFYWQLNQFQTFNDLQTIFSYNYLLTKPVKPISIFEEGFNVPKNIIGKLCFGINNINNQPYILEDSLGNDVTDNFESFYDISTRTIIFCSIPVYTSGTLFFKFKSI